MDPLPPGVGIIINQDHHLLECQRTAADSNSSHHQRVYDRVLAWVMWVLQFPGLGSLTTCEGESELSTNVLLIFLSIDTT